MRLGNEWQTVGGLVILRRGLALLMPLMTVPILPGIAPCAALDETIRPNTDDPGGFQDWLPGSGSGSTAHSRLSIETETDTVVTDTPGGSPKECSGSDFPVFKLEVGLEDPSSDPGFFACQAMDYTYRVRKIGSDPGTVDLDISLIQGTTTIDGPRLSADIDTYSNHGDSPTEAQYNSITDFDDLRLRIEATVCVDDILDNDVGCEMAWNKIVFSAK